MQKNPDSTVFGELSPKIPKPFFSIILGSLCMESKSRSFTVSSKAVHDFIEECIKNGPAHFMLDGNETTDLTMSVTWEK